MNKSKYTSRRVTKSTEPTVEIPCPGEAHSNPYIVRHGTCIKG